MVISFLQIRGPGRKHVHRAGTMEELHIKKSDKLSAIKTKFRSTGDKRTRLRSIYYSKLCFYPTAVSNASWSKLNTFLSVLEINCAHDHWLLTPEFQSVKLRSFSSTPTIHKMLEYITFALARRSPGWTWKTKETAHQFYLCKVIPADNNTAAENCRLLECINHHIPLMNAICPCGHSDSSTTAPWYSQHFSTSWCIH